MGAFEFGAVAYALPVKALGNLDTAPLATIFSKATFVYDGDGRRVKSVVTTDAGVSTTYFVGTHYEVTDGVVTKYRYLIVVIRGLKEGETKGF